MNTFHPPYDLRVTAPGPIQSLFDRLHNAIRLQASRLFGQSDVAGAIEIIESIAQYGNWQDIPSFLWILSNPHRSIRDAGAAAIDRIAASIPRPALAGFELRLRHATDRTYAWRHHVDVDWVLGHAWPDHVWGLYSMHPNGYIRQAAARHLVGSVEVTTALPYLLLRLNDWVPAIRTAAAREVKSFLLPRYIDAWVPVIGMLEGFRLRSRADHTWLLEGVEDLFLQPSSRSHLTILVQSADPNVVRWTFRIAMRLGEADRLEYILLALNHRDPVVRLQAAIAVRNWPRCPDHTALLARASQDPFMPIRREVLYAMLSADAGARQEHLRDTLLDAHPSMRYAARFYLQKEEGPSCSSSDTRSFYLDALESSEPTRLAAAIAGIGETGTRADADIIRPFVDHPTGAVAAAAVRTLALLDRNRHEELLIHLLADHRSAVARQACRALGRCEDATSVSALQQIAHGNGGERARRLALRVLLRRRPYDAIADAIRAAGSNMPSLVVIGARYIQWATPGRVRYAPTAQTLAVAQAALDSLPQKLPEYLMKCLAALLGTRLA